MSRHLDAGWTLEIQAGNVPADPSLRDRGPLHVTVERHRFGRFAGEPYYEEVPTRAAALLQTMIRLRPFEDYNSIIGAPCVWAHMHQVGAPIASTAQRHGRAGRRAP